MSTAVLPPQIGVPALPRKRFTRAEVQKMLDLGLFAGQRFELLDGDLIDKMGQNPPRASTIQLVLELLASLFGMARVRGQLPVEVALPDRERNFPEPDIAVLIEMKPDYVRRHPRGNELLLAVEVSDTSLSYDAAGKRDLYARAGVPEYWVVDLAGRRVLAYRALSQGSYTQTRTVTENESIALEAEPGKSIAVAGILPKA